MNAISAPLSLLSILWSVPLFLALTQKPVEPRSALPGGERLRKATAAPLFTMLTIALVCLLSGIVFYRFPPPWNRGFIDWLLSPGLLILVTAIGISLIPTSFRCSPLTSGVTRRSLSLFALGLAGVSCWPIARQATLDGNPFFFLIATAGVLLPDLLANWISRFWRKVDIHVAPDPLAPDPQLVANALATAINRCDSNQQWLRLQLYPGQDASGRWLKYTVRLTGPRHTITVSQANQVAVAPLSVRVSCQGTYTVETADAPLSLDFAPTQNGYVRVSDNPWRQGWSHSYYIAGLLAAVTWLFAGWLAAVIMAGAFCLHILTDQAGYRGADTAFTPTTGPTTGFQLISPRRMRRFHIAIIWLSIVILGWNWTGHVASAATPPLIPLLLLGWALPVMIYWRTTRREITAISAQ